MQDPDNTTPHLASAYDIQVRQTIPMYDVIYDQVMDMVAAVKPKPAKWLDTGCGTGTLIALAAPRLPGTAFILSDPSPEMLAIARAKLEQVETFDARRLQFLEPCATQDLRLEIQVADDPGPEENSRPDVITAIQAHHYLSPEQRRKATERCFELLAPGGLYITFENSRPRTSAGINVALDRVYSFQIGAGKSQEDAVKHRQRFDREYHPITIEEHLKLYRECGFAVVELFWFSYFQAGFYCLKE